MGVSGCSALKHIAKKMTGRVEVIAVFAHDFLEWNLSATYFFANPAEYYKFVSRDKEKFEVTGVSYEYDVCVEVRPKESVVVLKSGKELEYDALVLALGYKIPLIQRQLGCTYEERKAEVEEWGAAIAAAKTVVVSGPGATGLEYVGDIKKAYPSCRVVLLSRSGQLMSDAYPDSLREKFVKVLEAQGVEILKGSAGTEPLKTKGAIQIDGGDLEYDVFLPAFGQGLATDFLPDDLLNAKGEIMTNDCLQSKEHPEIFAIGVNDKGQGFSAPKLDKQANDTAANAVNFVLGKPLKPHAPLHPEKDWAVRPMTVKIGYGEYIYWDATQFDPVFKCMTCDGKCGFPCGPPICFWLCGNCTAPFACGLCGSECEGKRPAEFYTNCMGIGGVKIFAPMFGMTGFTNNPPLDGGAAPVPDTMLR
ncbi:hypothetical protein CTAYLR_003629 [Chrysophaeum taylorii]|uniref:FAD/NAD(P)-binding domain-containing protein n=1 Tax=Chrysophaeum taylorii TaxID=2483200 RepID=A0AAD7XNG0_9STRA|nr:hypothetical protein CTAYLR_003629 [Chrysophaeum taylorii]